MSKIKKTNNGKKGGVLDGDFHSAPSGGIKAVVTDDDNRPVLLEKNEAIINKAAVKKHWKTLSKINQSAGNGVPILPPTEMKTGGEVGKEIWKHKHMDATAKIISETAKGYKVEFTDNTGRKPKTKIQFFDKQDFKGDRAFFEKMKFGGELKDGIEAEKEHEGTAEKLYEHKIKPEDAPESIAKEHLKEDPHYYTKLKEVESKFDTGGGVDAEEPERESVSFSNVDEGDYVEVYEYDVATEGIKKVDEGKVTFKYGRHYLNLNGENTKYDHRNTYYLADHPKIEPPKEKENAGAIFYTTAPERIDGFGTKTIEVTDWLDSKNAPVRKIFIPEKNFDWQKNRNASGNYGTFTEEQFKEFTEKTTTIFHKEHPKTEDYESKTFDELIAIKKKKYANPDIESPMSDDEKLLTKVMAKKASEMNQQVILRRAKKKSAEKLKTLASLLNEEIGVDNFPENEQQFVDKLIKDTVSGVEFNKVRLEKLAKTYGITTQNLIKELAELSICHLGRVYAHESGLTEKERFDKIVQLYKTQVNLSHRTSESIMLQQYSTPAPIGYLAGLFCGFDKVGGQYFEPSGGNGLLTIAGIAKDFTVNEIDTIRNRNLQVQGFKEVLKQDATEPFKNFEKKFDAVITNPPFGTTDAVTYDKVEIKSLEQLMSLRALDTMKNAGKCAIIIGGHQEFDSEGRIKAGKNRTFFVYLYKHYNVVDVINISGRHLYSRQGTSFNTRLILINGRKENPSGFPPLIEKLTPMEQTDSYAPVDNYESLWQRITKLF